MVLALALVVLVVLEWGDHGHGECSIDCLRHATNVLALQGEGEGEEGRVVRVMLRARVTWM